MSKWKKSLTLKFMRIEKQGVDDEIEREYEADVVVDVSFDPNYGADADGHRGILRDFIDGVEITELRIIENNRVIKTLVGDDVSEDIYSLVIEKVSGEDLSPDESDREEV